MKTFIYTVTILLLSGTVFGQTQEKPVNADVTFGRYGSDCSSGRGACSFTAAKPNSDVILEKNSTRVSPTSFLLQLKRSVLTKDEEVRIAGTVFNEVNSEEALFFVQETDLSLSSTTLQNLKIDTKYSLIAAGSYPMVITKDKVEITFSLKDPNEQKR